MLYQITNLTPSTKAFRSVNSGEMVFVPPRSEGTYDLAPLPNLSVAGVEIKEASAVTPAVAVDPEPPAEAMADDPPPADPEPPVVEPKASKGKVVVEPGAAPWQQGLANSVKA